MKKIIVHNQLNEMLRALMESDVDTFGKYLQEILERVMSFHDIRGDDPENIYHVFVLGLLVNLENKYEVDSNRESGHGRYDIVMIPRSSDIQGIIMEFKRTKENEDPEKDLETALKQIKEKDYEKKLRDKGFHHNLAIAVVFQKKKVWTAHEVL